MKERSDWMEGLLWAEEYIEKGVFFEDDEIGIDSLRWELNNPRDLFPDGYDGEFLRGVWSYLEHFEGRWND